VDSIFMAPQLGVLSAVHEQAATQVFERDCLVRLGAVLAPIGNAKPGHACLRVELGEGGAARAHEVRSGELVRLPLPEGGTVRLRAMPDRAFDLGLGRGRALEAEVLGGAVGLIVDTRGRRPFTLPAADATRIQCLRDWNRALAVYPREV